MREQGFVVTRCPRCSQTHEFILAIESVTPNGEPVAAAPAAVPRVLTFAGQEDPDHVAWDVLFTCPAENLVFTETIHLPDHAGTVTSVSSKCQEQRPTTGGTADPGSASAEYLDWIKNSLTSARDFGKTMIATSSGAVPIYFATLKYVGSEHLGTSWGWIPLVPPIILVGAVVVFAMAIRPSLLTLGLDEFAQIRNRRLLRMNRLLTSGTAAFLVALLLSLAVFVDFFLRSTGP